MSTDEKPIPVQTLWGCAVMFLVPALLIGGCWMRSGSSKSPELWNYESEKTLAGWAMGKLAVQEKLVKTLVADRAMRVARGETINPARDARIRREIQTLNELTVEAEDCLEKVKRAKLAAGL